MSIIFILIPIAILFVSIAIALFFWAVKSDQFEDLDREGVNILFDEDQPSVENAAKKTKTPE
ncbi:cbb3-type cytochrome oxidase assembly protein CcoS [Motilimonas cestriensis]|uniref:Cbb3-type cytochrome oxidase assembly protein CcoS n=1 Tax=Motilimonas cestriensis TaxID=2742685 RepID=A0ABS8WHA5_9GAMM|nr:cbb3-type cytochrome oxidase assembly protein CcoS [Motilimonas cestriensis]MCE2597141.1 cbb3-type cytochrome oxidase assembly protein CcoS [Motilimonas cestriensis]